MVKCPKGTPSQIKANLARIKEIETFALENNILSHDENAGDEEAKNESAPSEELEPDCNKTDKMYSLSPRDELVNFFINFLLDILIKRWDGKPCYRQKLRETNTFSRSQSEEIGENDLLPCEYPSVFSTISADYIKDLYTKRSATLTKEKSFQNNKTSSTNSNVYEESFQNHEEDFGEFEDTDPWKSAPGGEVHLEFLNGAWYKGRVFRRLMEGEGCYFWEDGTSYQGEFVGGCATGKGRLEFSCQSVYEGEVYKAFRHGEGMHCLFDSPVMYTGQWWLGKKHGEGLIVYNEPSKGHNFYKGQWQNGEKEGFGYRQYPSGAKYIGFWSNGKRHGKGVMFWKNNDIYRGYWKEGLMHGYGEYTWNGFINKTLSYPATNTYRGYWSQGKRSGQGTFETINDGVIETVWENNVKDGPGVVICANNTVVTSECLFYKDKQASLNSEDEATELWLKEHTAENKQSLSNYNGEKIITNFLNNLPKGNTVSIPIHSSICSIRLSHFIHKLKVKKEEFLDKYLKAYPRLPIKVRKSFKEFMKHLSDNELADEFSEDSFYTHECPDEEKVLRNAIASKISKLKVCYNKYATMACEKQPPFKCVLLRLFFWQMLIDCQIPDSNTSLVDIDEILAREDYLLIKTPHNPFERIRFGQFMHIVLVLSWYLYGQYVFYRNPLILGTRVLKFLEVYHNSDFKYLLGMAFNYFVENDISAAYSNRKAKEQRGEKTFFENDLAPMEAMYSIYRNLGEPHSARLFLSKVCSRKCKEAAMPDLLKSFQNLPSHMFEGKNALTVAGELAYIPGPKPFNFPEIIETNSDNIRTRAKPDMLFCSGLSPKRVVQCLTQVCPSICIDGYLVHMDYQLTFLEFYNTIILCTELSLKLNAMKKIRNDIIQDYRKKLEEYQRMVSEQEKLKDSKVVLDRRSRQLISTSRKGK